MNSLFCDTRNIINIIIFSQPGLPEVGGTTGFGMPFNACGNCPAANAVIGLMYVPCAVAAAMSAACCYNKKNFNQKERSLSYFSITILLNSFWIYCKKKKTKSWWIICLINIFFIRELFIPHFDEKEIAAKNIFSIILKNIVECRILKM